MAGPEASVRGVEVDDEGVDAEPVHRRHLELAHGGEDPVPRLRDLVERGDHVAGDRVVVAVGQRHTGAVLELVDPQGAAHAIRTVVESLRWLGLAVTGLVVLVLGREVYLAEWLVFWSGLFAVLGTLVGTAGFVLDGLSRWELSGETAMERTETRRVNAPAAGAPVRLARKQAANRIRLSRWEFDRG